jgi:hypothetical protein
MKALPTSDISLHVLSRLSDNSEDFVRSVSEHRVLDFYTHVGRNRFLGLVSKSLIGLDLEMSSTAKAEDRISAWLFLQRDSEVGTRADKPWALDHIAKDEHGTDEDLLHGLISLQLECAGLNLRLASPCFDAYTLGGLLELDLFLDLLDLPKPPELFIFLTHLKLQLEKVSRYTLQPCPPLP